MNVTLSTTAAEGHDSGKASGVWVQREELRTSAACLSGVPTPSWMDGRVGGRRGPRRHPQGNISLGPHSPAVPSRPVCRPEGRPRPWGGGGGMRTQAPGDTAHTWRGAVTDRGRHLVTRPDHAIHLQSHANQCYLHTSLGAVERRVGTFTGLPGDEASLWGERHPSQQSFQVPSPGPRPQEPRAETEADVVPSGGLGLVPRGELGPGRSQPREH